MKKTVFFLKTIFVWFAVTTIQAQQLITFDSIPNRNSSDYYLCKVKFANEPDSEFRDANVLQTRAKEASEDPEGAYYGTLRGFTASWVAFESDFTNNVVVEISKRDGTPITKAMVRPVGDAQPATITNGKAYVTFTEPANVNVDINGQMEDNYTGYGYNGAKVHTISLFANPIFNAPTGTDVKVLQTNEDIRTIDRTQYSKIVFAPGVHDVGLSYKIHSHETYFIPGDAIVKGTMHPKDAWGNSASKNFKVYGSGTFSSEHIVRHPDDDDNKSVKPFTYQAEGAHLEGFVVVDPAFHTFNMNHTGDPNNINIYKNLKILAWRINSDGINAFKNSEVSDCFFRVQDDAFYYGVENVNQHDNTVWNDANGAVLFLQNIVDGSTSTFRDVKVIYHRAHWHWWNGGRIVSMRQFRDNKSISNVTIKNIFVEDPLPAFPPFYATMDANATGTEMTLNNIVFENIQQEHDGVVTNLPNDKTKPQNTLKGYTNQLWENITFKNCYFNGKTLTSFADGDFYTENVDSTTVVFLADKLTNITSPEEVTPYKTATVTIDYFASETRDLQAFIQLNRSPWTSYGSKRVTINPGSGTESLSFEIDANIPLENDAYKIVVNLLPVGLGWPDRLDEKVAFNIDAVEGNDELINVTAPQQISPNETITVNVDYFAKEIIDLRVFIKANNLPSQEFGSKRVTINPGFGSESLPFQVDANITVENGPYKIVTNLLPVGLGWPDRLDQKIINNISVDVSAQKSLSTIDMDKDNFTIFPNPTRNNASITSSFTLKKIKIYSLSGRLIFEKKVNAKECDINLSGYAKGVYFIEASNNSIQSVNRLILE
ncbi:T9SS type A sorting domain-containing protein [Polaribacter sp.]|uniref:T9SS type A sorting domain-containing protein n=1 Tax=Polaribacter sp. TaxID=1920175 RepID=UPI003F6BA391